MERNTSYFNLFYWKLLRNIDSTIGLHPHKGFEIITFVLSGEYLHLKHFIK